MRNEFTAATLTIVAVPLLTLLTLYGAVMLVHRVFGVWL